MNAGILSGNVNASSLNAANTNFTFSDINNQINDHVAVGFVDLEYARQFIFDGSQILNFNYLLQQPVIF